ncbi:MAG: AMP-binding protein, partial [Gemmatimonadota bacterium]
MDGSRSREIEVLLTEDRSFDPPVAFSAEAHVSGEAPYAAARGDREAFWEGQAEQLDWFRRWDNVLSWDPPFARWFEGGRLNVSHNCLDRHLDGLRADSTALTWEGEPGDRRAYTYRELHAEVCAFAAALKRLGVNRGDRVGVYLPMIPEAAIAMLACTRIGAPHSVVFGGFSAKSLRDRMIDAQARVLITADGGYRRGSIVPLKQTSDEAVDGLDFVDHVVVVRREEDGQTVGMREGRDHWYHDLIAEGGTCEPEVMDAEDILYILYTSGTTGKPKGIVHTTGGYLTQVT